MAHRCKVKVSRMCGRFGSRPRATKVHGSERAKLASSVFPPFPPHQVMANPKLLAVVEAMSATMSSTMAKKLEQLVATIVESMNAGGRGGNRKGLDDRHLRPIEQIDGRGNWSDWSSGFKSVSRSADGGLRTTEIAPGAVEDHTPDAEVDASGGKLYHKRVELRGGETRATVRGTEAMSGFVAWRRLCERYNPPNTPAKALATMMDMMRPNPQTDPNKVPQTIDASDLKVQNFERQFGEKVSDRMKTAIMLCVCSHGTFKISCTSKPRTSKITRTLSRGPTACYKTGLGGAKSSQWRSGRSGPRGPAPQLKTTRRSGKGKAKGRGGACHLCGQMGHFER